MSREKPYVVKIAENQDELEQIVALNYRTFVEEIPQHAPNPVATLRDKFHDKNTYFICKKGSDVAGMVCCCSTRPFSLDAKVPELNNYLPTHHKPCEIRLLAVQKRYRRTRVALLLFRALATYLLQEQYDLAVISGTTRQIGMYEKMGFRPFYQLVGVPGAYYQPMYITQAKLTGAAWLH